MLSLFTLFVLYMFSTGPKKPYLGSGQLRYFLRNAIKEPICYCFFVVNCFSLVSDYSAGYIMTSVAATSTDCPVYIYIYN